MTTPPDATPLDDTVDRPLPAPRDRGVHRPPHTGTTLREHLELR